MRATRYATMPALLTPRELAAALRVSEATVYRDLAAGTVPAIRVGGVLRVRADQLERLLADGSAPEPPDGAAPATTASAAVVRGRRPPQSAP